MKSNRTSRLVDRRRFVRTTAAALSGTALVGHAAGSDRDESAGTDAVGVTNAVSALLRKGEIGKAERLLETHDVEYYGSKRNLGGDGPSTQATWDPSESYVTIHVYHRTGDVYSVTGGVWLKGSSDSWRYTSKAQDAMGLTYYNNDWAPEDPDTSELEYGVSYFEGDDAGAPDLTNADYDPNSGVGLKVDVPTEATVGYKTRAYVETTLEDRTDDDTDATPVLFEYQQNSAYSATLSGVSVSVGGLGISVDLNNATKEWDDDVTAGPGEYDNTN